MQWPRFDPKSGHVGFVVDKVALGQVFSQYFSFPCQFSFHQMLHTHLSSGAGSIGQLVADVPSGLSLTPLYEYKKEKYLSTKQHGVTFQKTEDFASIFANTCAS
jgi:hypothetical protein